MISFVIPALEADEKYLYNCLDSVVDEILANGSRSDEVIAVVKLQKSTEEEFRARIWNRYGEVVRCVFDPGNRSVARNIGLKLAKNDILTFLDADSEISYNFIPTTIRDLNGHTFVNYSTRPLDGEVAGARRLYFYARFMNLVQWVFTHLGRCKPYGFGTSVKKDYCKASAYNGEVFLEELAGHGEDAEFGGRYNDYCKNLGLGIGEYEGDIIVKTSFREWHHWGFWRGGVRMIANTFRTPRSRQSTFRNWK